MAEINLKAGDELKHTMPFVGTVVFKVISVDDRGRITAQFVRVEEP